MDHADARRQSFIRWMEEVGTSAYGVRKTSGVPQSTLYGWIRGGTRTLKSNVEAQIAAAHGTTVDRIFGGSTQSDDIDVVGKIGARAEVRPFDDANEAMYRVPILPTMKPDEEYVGFEIEGFSMPPARPGWVVLFRKVETSIDQLVGFPCLVDLEDGRRLFKELRRGYTPGRWNLVSWDGSEPMEDEIVVAALPFAGMTPGRQQR